ncbi:MAG TPA: SAM-dependent methyltransferase [Thermoanaerobaculia bacterium]|nr:SAM-dependent methyltransferase [Thermoanaerobaculia bacterium]
MFPRLHSRIRAQGPIPFAAFMEEALYGEGGYYNREDVPIGEPGDYVTGASLSPLFGRVTARLLRRLDEALGQPAEMFEAGFGTGVHLANVVSSLVDRGRKVRAWDRIARKVPAGVEQIGSLEAIGEGEVEGLIFSYELFDALPVHRFLGKGDGAVGELWVDVDQEGAFAWREGELSDPALLGLLHGVSLQPGQVADVSPGWGPLYGDLARRLGRGLLVTCDYGFERERLFDPRVRLHGTLACYTRQRVHRNPFVKVGEQDLTAHVDFTTLIREGEAAGLTTVVLTRQALWLTACGLFEELQGADVATRHGAMALLDGEGMGEEIRVLVQAKGIDPAAVLDLKMLGARPAKEIENLSG